MQSGGRGLTFVGRPPELLAAVVKEDVMPRAKVNRSEPVRENVSRGQKRKIQKDDQWGGFVQVSLDEAHRDEFDMWAGETGTGIYRELTDALDSGLKFTLSYDGANQCHIATLTGRPDVSGERGFTCCLSARAGTFEDAIAVLMYKHASLLHYDWWDAVNEPKRSRFSFG